MNRKDISEALGDISDRHINEAAKYKTKSNRKIRIKFISVAACLCIVTAFAVLAMVNIFNTSKPPLYPPSTSGSVVPSSTTPTPTETIDLGIPDLGIPDLGVPRPALYAIKSYEKYLKICEEYPSFGNNIIKFEELGLEGYFDAMVFGCVDPDEEEFFKKFDSEIQTYCYQIRVTNDVAYEVIIENAPNLEEWIKEEPKVERILVPAQYGYWCDRCFDGLMCFTEKDGDGTHCFIGDMNDLKNLHLHDNLLIVYEDIVYHYYEGDIWSVYFSIGDYTIGIFLDVDADAEYLLEHYLTGHEKIKQLIADIEKRILEDEK